MYALVGNWTPEWGHTWLCRGFGKVYALRSLAGGSSLCVFDEKTMAPLGEFKTPGEHSCHITLLERQAVVSDYTSGSLSIFPLNPDGIPKGEPQVLYFEGSGPVKGRQDSPHIHSSWLTPEGDALVVVDLGSDRIYRFRLKDGELRTDGIEAFSAPEGSGPRHCAFGKDKLYVATELSDEVLVFNWPSMELVQRVNVNPAHPGGGGHIVLKDNYVYVSSRLENDGIAIFRIAGDGLLEKIDYIHTGKHPRHFCLSPDESTLAVACRDDDKIQLFSISLEDGSLSLEGECALVSKPVYIELI